MEKLTEVIRAALVEEYGEELCEECELYGTTGTDHCEADCVRVAIEALECMKKIKMLLAMDNEQHTRSIKLSELKEVCGL